MWMTLTPLRPKLFRRFSEFLSIFFLDLFFVCHVPFCRGGCISMAVTFHSLELYKPGIHSLVYQFTAVCDIDIA